MRSYYKSLLLTFLNLSFLMAEVKNVQQQLIELRTSSNQSIVKTLQTLAEMYKAAQTLDNSKEAKSIAIMYHMLISRASNHGLIKVPVFGSSIGVFNVKYDPVVAWLIPPSMFDSSKKDKSYKESNAHLTYRTGVRAIKNFIKQYAILDATYVPDADDADDS